MNFYCRHKIIATAIATKIRISPTLCCTFAGAQSHECSTSVVHSGSSSEVQSCTVSPISGCSPADSSTLVSIESHKCTPCTVHISYTNEAYPGTASSVCARPPTSRSSLLSPECHERIRCTVNVGDMSKVDVCTIST